MKTAGLVLLFGAIGAVMGLLIQAAFLLLGARIVGVEGRSYSKALVTVLLGGLASLLAWLVLGSVPMVGAVLAFVGGFIVVALIMVPIFGTTFGRALGASILAWVIGWVIVGGLCLLISAVFLGGIATLL